MLVFVNDYSVGAHPQVLQALVSTNEEKLSGYGTDIYTTRAIEKIKKACDNQNAEVYLLTGGTQTNKIVIDTMLKQYEAVISVTSGHINVHEAGAVESTGRKIIPLQGYDGKIDPEVLERYMSDFVNDDNNSHMVFPAMVYISHPTELGTLYTKDELTRIHDTCKRYGMNLFMDGARLGYGLASKTDLTLKDINELTDVFYFGGTKQGLLCGEAVVFTHNNMPDHFVTLVKKHGALLAKGRLLGVQFDAAFTDDLYFRISENAIERADELRKALKEKGYRFFVETPTNQIFVIMENKKLEQLKKQVVYSFWERYDEEHTVIRFATSWATTREEVEGLIELL